jgi:multiple sugar transport system ATP-binding protein
MADKIVVLHDGRIEQTGPPLELYNAPRTRFVAGFLGSPKMNFLKLSAPRDGRLMVDQKALALLRSGGQLRAADELGIRPEHVSVVCAEGQLPLLPLRVELIENLGGQSIIYATTPGQQPMTVAVEGQLRFEPGTTIQSFVKPEACHLFDGDGNAIR